MERVLGNKVNFWNKVIYSLSILTSCQFTNEANREIPRGVFQNRWVCGHSFPHRGPTQSVGVADCYFIVNVLDLPFASPIAIYR